MAPKSVQDKFPDDKYFYVKQWYIPHRKWESAVPKKMHAIRWWSPKRRDEIISLAKFTMEVWATFEDVSEFVRAGEEYVNA